MSRPARLPALVLCCVALALLPIGYLHADAGELLDPSRYLLSDYAAVPGGTTLLALSMAGLIVAGMALIAALGTLPGSGPIRLLLLSWCAGLAVAATFPTNAPGTDPDTSALVHRYAAGWMLASLPLAGWLLARTCAQLPGGRANVGRLRGLSVLTGAAGVAFLLGHVLASSPRVAGLGLLQRGLLALELGVLAAAAVAVYRSARPSEEPPLRRQEKPVRPLRIVLGADTYPPDVNGAARFTQRLAHGLAGRGHEVHLLCPSVDGPALAFGSSGVWEHRLTSHRTPLHPTFRACLPWQVRAPVHDHLRILAPDLVHVQSHFVVGRALVDASEQLGIPLVATNHFMPENLLGYARVPRSLHGPVSRWAWRDLAGVYGGARVLTAPTPSAVQLLARAAGLPGAVPVSCGIDLDRFHPGGHPGADPTVLFVGRLDPEKRVHELLRALAALSDDIPVRAEVIGDGACRRQLETLTDRLGIRDRVRFHGVVGEDELVAAYQRASVFCMPGIAELQSLATMEAMAAATPVVAADAMALPHLVRPGVTGWLYPPGDVAALSAALRRLLSDPELGRRMGAAGRNLVVAHDIDRTLDAFEELYGDAVSDRGTRQLVAAWMP